MRGYVIEIEYEKICHWDRIWEDMSLRYNMREDMLLRYNIREDM